MRVLLYSHESCWRHDAGPFHPERPDRLTAAVAGVRRSGLEVVEREPPEASVAELAVVHDSHYIEGIRAHCARGGGPLDPDTAAVEDSWEAALRSAGAGLAAVEDLRAGTGDFAFLAVRPPGHHALAGRAMGFCLFNNIAVTAQSLASRGERVAIVDWDVHHGNGTQEMFYADGAVLYVSAHEFPAYPGSGWVDERGTGEGKGTTINLPFPAATHGDVYRAAFRRVVRPVLEEFRPDWILVSAGYDAHTSDPLAGIRLVEADYADMAEQISGIAPERRLVFFLEGGYDLEAIEGSVAATLQGCAGIATSGPPGGTTPQSHPAWAVLAAVESEVQERWKVRKDRP